MTHDPMCWEQGRRGIPTANCLPCDLIARVRADEREKADCPDPSICDRHNCAAAAAYCDGVADERERYTADGYGAQQGEMMPDPEGPWMLAADHARIVAEVREKALNDAKRAVRAECYHDSDEWCVFVAAIDGLIGDKR